MNEFILSTDFQANMEKSIQPSLTLKVVGHQWYWSYEYPEVHLLEEANPETLKVSDVPPAEAYFKKGKSIRFKTTLL